MRAQSAEIAQQGSKIADTKAADAKPADDMPLRRVVAAALLDVAGSDRRSLSGGAGRGEGAGAQSGCAEAARQFAAKGVPSAGSAQPRIADAGAKIVAAGAAGQATTGTGIVERLQAGAAKLVRIERTDTVGNDRGAMVARVTAAALRNDFDEARRELKTLAPADRAAAQSWLDKADARDAALAASRQFAADAMAALAKPAQ